MEGDPKRGDVHPQLFNMISKERDLEAIEAEEKKLELRLGPPGEDYTVKKSSNNSSAGAKRLFLETVVTNTDSALQKNQPQRTCFLQLQSSPSLNGEQPDIKIIERKASRNGDVKNNCSETRTNSVPVVGWPPIRSFRRNIAGSSSKPAPIESQNGDSKSVEEVDNCKKGLFVKINMDGIPIGRKVNLKVYDSYEKLSSAVDELFRGLLAVQTDPSAIGNQNNANKSQAITGLLDGSGEYTLVYEDNEGDRMLVGDVPWEMFMSTVKRLRVLKTSELPALSLVAANRKKIPD